MRKFIEIIILFGCLMIVFAKYANGHKYVDYLQKSIVFYNKTVRIVQFGHSTCYERIVLIQHGHSPQFIPPDDESYICIACDNVLPGMTVSQHSLEESKYYFKLYENSCGPDGYKNYTIKLKAGCNIILDT